MLEARPGAATPAGLGLGGWDSSHASAASGGCGSPTSRALTQKAGGNRERVARGGLAVAPWHSHCEPAALWNMVRGHRRVGLEAVASVQAGRPGLRDT